MLERQGDTVMPAVGVEEEVERVLLGEAQQESRPGPKILFWLSCGIKCGDQL